MAYIPQAGDIAWTDLDPRTGREQGGRRPVIVISETAFWQATGMIILCPITSTIRPFPSSVVLPKSLLVQGEILTGQVRAIDAMARVFSFSGTRVPSETLEELREKLGALLGIF